MRKNQMSENGITLIVLVVTIVILLILTGISMNLILGDNGIVYKAKLAKIETRGATVEERRDLWKADKKINSKNVQTLEELIADLVNKKLLTEEEKNQILGNEEKNIDATGKVTIGSRTIVFVENYIANCVNVGDYVKYDPTVKNRLGENVEENKLVYKSPEGTTPTTDSGIITHGNGYGEQIFVASSDIKWRVLSIDQERGTVKLISENAVKTNENENFILKGGIGYLYAEEEIQKACSIYGYGYGAETSLEITYKVGGPYDDLITKKIEGTGARSISIKEDIKPEFNYHENELEEKDDIVDLETAIYYPTLHSTSINIPAQSTLKQARFERTYNSVHSSICGTKSESRKILFDFGSYWIASQCVNINQTGTFFMVRSVEKNFVSGVSLNTGGYKSLSQTFSTDYGIRPIVIIKSNIEVEKSKTEENTWILK